MRNDFHSALVPFFAAAVITFMTCALVVVLVIFILPAAELIAPQSSSSFSSVVPTLSAFTVICGMMQIIIISTSARLHKFFPICRIIFFFAFIYIPPYASLLFFKISLLCLFEYVQYLEESFEQFPNVIEDTFLALD